MTGLRPGRPLRLALGLIVPVTYVLAVELALGWRAVVEQLATAGMWPVVLVAGGMGLSYLLRALRLCRVLGASIRRWPALLAALLLNNAANWLLPARIGDLSLPVLLSHGVGLRLSQGAATLLWLRVLDLLALAFIAGAALLLLGSGLQRGLGAILLVAASGAPFLLRPVMGPLGRAWPRVAPVLALLSRPPARMGGDALLAVLAWLVKLLALAAALSQLATAPLLPALAGVIGGELSTVLPIHAPLGAGSFSAGIWLGMSPWPGDTGQRLTAALQLHLLMLSVALLAAVAALLLRGRPADFSPATPPRKP